MTYQIMFIPTGSAELQVLATTATADAATLAFQAARDALRARGASGELFLLGPSLERRVVLHETLAPTEWDPHLGRPAAPEATA